MAQAIAAWKIQKDAQREVAETFGKILCTLDSLSEVVVEVGEIGRRLKLMHCGMCFTDGSSGPQDRERVATEQHEQVVAVNLLGDDSRTPVDRDDVQECGNRVPLCV